MTEWEKFERMVNLKSEAVELGLVQDLESLYKIYSDIAIESIKTKAKIQGEINKLASTLDKALKAKQEAERKNELLNKSSKDLGIELPEISKKVNNSDNFPIERLLNWANQASKD
jgi:hypothetical protein